MKLTDFNYRDGFEKMLKETADRFCLEPPVYIWNSIYNNFHPSSRWPSLSTWLFFSAWLLLFSMPVKKGGHVQKQSGTKNYSAAEIPLHKGNFKQQEPGVRLHSLAYLPNVPHRQNESKAEKKLKHSSELQSIHISNEEASARETISTLDDLSFSKTPKKNKHFSFRDPVFRGSSYSVFHKRVDDQVPGCLMCMVHALKGTIALLATLEVSRTSVLTA
jgi:hypothetical protein